MSTLQSRQRMRTRKQMRTRKRGGSPRVSPSSSIERTHSSLMREVENLPSPPTAFHTKESIKRENLQRQKFRIAMSKLVADLKASVRDEYVGKPRFTTQKKWTIKWQEILDEMDSLAKTYSVVRGKPDLFWTKQGHMGYAMKELKKKHEGYMKKSTGTSKRTKKKKTPKKKKRTYTKSRRGH